MCWHPELPAADDHMYVSRPVCSAACLPGAQLTVRQLLPWTRDNLLQERPELFMKGETV